MKHVVIVGNGIAGVTAARYIRKRSDYAITIVSAESKHFFSRTALMYVYMGHMRLKDITPYEDWFWTKNQINLIQAYVEHVDTTHRRLQLSSGKDLQYDILIIASGSSYNKFNWPGQDLMGVGGLYSLQDLEYMEYWTKNAKRGVIVGGGLIGIEMAEMLISRHVEVSFLVREKSYWNNVIPAEESEMVNRHIREHHVDLRLGTELAEIIGDAEGRVKAVKTSHGDIIECEWVGLTAGVRPNIGFLKNSGIDLGRGVMVNEFLETNVPDVYAIGDCAEFRNPLPQRKPVEQVWYTGKMQGETVALNITGKRSPYTPGFWFNSAKFFDIEYQVYGEVPSRLPDDEDTLFWESPDNRKSIRINFKRDSQVVTGFNLMGVRYRHKVCDRWLHEGRTLDYVVENLCAANFDPEFFATYEHEIVKLYTAKTGKKVRPKRRGNLLSMIFGKHSLAKEPKATQQPDLSKNPVH
jgi:NADPH-dependent 2,4-dienoyl-CoA reductase/sulfur reductase-like enzyme